MDFELKRYIPQRDVMTTSVSMIFVLFFGVFFLYKLYDIKSKAGDKVPKLPLYIAMFMSLILILAPIVLFFIGASGNYSKIPALSQIDSVIKTQVILLIFVVVFLIVMLYLTSELRKLNIEIDSTTNIAMYLLLIGTVVITGLRYFYDNKEIEQAKQEKSYLRKVSDITGEVLSKQTSNLTKSYTQAQEAGRKGSLTSGLAYGAGAVRGYVSSFF